MTRGGIIFGLGALAIVGLLLAISGNELGPGGKAARTASNLCSQPQKIAKILDIADGLGVFPGRRADITEVDERVWADLPRDAKINVTLAAYCAVADASGNGSVIMRGWRDGETKASMTNGNYLD